MRVQQIPLQVWSSGGRSAVAVLAFEPEVLSQRFGLVFEEEVDDLGNLRRAAILLADGSQALLMQHRDNPSPGTPVYVDAGADYDAARELVLAALGLMPGDYSWVSPEARAPEWLAKKFRTDPGKETRR